MSLAEVLSAARALPRDEQLELARSLTDYTPTTEAGRPETDAQLLQRLMPAGSQFEVWSPFESAEAANILLQLLDATRETK